MPVLVIEGFATLYRDGTVILPDHVSASDAARAFWDDVGRYITEASAEEQAVIDAARAFVQQVETAGGGGLIGATPAYRRLRDAVARTG